MSNFLHKAFSLSETEATRVKTEEKKAQTELVKASTELSKEIEKATKQQIRHDNLDITRAIETEKFLVNAEEEQQKQPFE